MFRCISVLCYVRVRTGENSKSEKVLKDTVKDALRYKETVKHCMVYYVNITHGCTHNYTIN